MSAKISALTALAASDIAADDVLPIVDTSAAQTKKVTHTALTAAVNASLDVAGPGGPCLVTPVEVLAILNSSTEDADFVLLDLSDLIPPGATIAWIHAGIYSPAASATKALALRSPGDVLGSIDSDGSVRAIPVLGAAYCTIYAPIRLSADRMIEYRRINTPASATWYRINLMGFS